MRIDYQILLKSPPPPSKRTGWIRPCFKGPVVARITWRQCCQNS